MMQSALQFVLHTHVSPNRKTSLTEVQAKVVAASLGFALLAPRDSDDQRRTSNR